MEASSRVAIALLLALGVWVVAYWLTPAGEPSVSPTVAGADDVAAFEPPVSFQRPPADTGGGRAGGPDGVRTDGERGGPGGEGDGVGEVEGGGADGVRVVPPEFVEYVVQPGDTTDGISRKFYGTRKHWDAILRANPLTDLHRRLRVGMTIRVPKDPTNVQGKLVREGDGSEREPVEDTAGGRAGPGGPGGPGGPEYIEYTVRRGDTLSEISQRVYGTASLWTLIRDANVDKAGANGTRIRPGMVLRIPPKPASDA